MLRGGQGSLILAAKFHGKAGGKNDGEMVHPTTEMLRQKEIGFLVPLFHINTVVQG